ncbi:xanthine dehydrogenase family protein molybdopterin-binding subunit [Nocardia sp. KC 131]|uniref:xanthine dehydrogenase family protein molybdopterin-binding subunit n=1 Tax=Nocardia arseniciresistens TaxID=3392119 RepID=UPI00398E3C8B
MGTETAPVKPTSSSAFDASIPTVGTSVGRREDARLLEGRGSFLADRAVGARHAVFVRSTEPHARVTRIETAAALELPGVVGVFTAADLGLSGTFIAPLTVPDARFAERTAFEIAEQRLPVLGYETAMYVGQPLAVVVADTRYHAEDAAEAVAVLYEPLTPIASADIALADDTTPLFDHLPDNVAACIAYDFGNPDSAFAGAAHIVEGTYTMGRHGAVPLECRGVRVDPDIRTGCIRMTSSTQIPHLVRKAVTRALGWDELDLVVIVPDVGGGFGTKANVYSEEVVLAALARHTGWSVIWVEDRQEHLASAAQGRDQVHRTKLGVDERGRIVAWQSVFVVDIGAGSLWVAGIVANTAVHLMGPYRIPHGRIRGTAALTNKTIVAQYRGAGRPEASFALERALDAAARELHMDPVEIRRRNLLDAMDLPYPRPIPYRDGVPIVYDGGDYRACLERVIDLLPRSATAVYEERHPEMQIGYSVAAYLEATGRGPYEVARVVLLPGGTFEVTAGSAAAGQGHETTFAQVAADALEVPFDLVRYTVSDTERLVDGTGTYASRSAVVAGSAIHRACRKLIELTCQRLAEEHGGQPTYRAGMFTLADSHLEWSEIAAATRAGGAFEEHAATDVTATFRPETVTWTMGVHAAVVGVDRRTGVVTVLRYAVAHEGGIEINPQIVHGQIVGGVAQGIGGALFEKWGYSPAGEPMSTTFAGYHLPLTTDIPDIAVAHLHVDTPANPIGVRGAGESGTIAVYAALAGAVDDALGERVHVDTTPIDPATLWRMQHGEVIHA